MDREGEPLAGTRSLSKNGNFVNTLPLYCADSWLAGTMAIQSGTHLGPYEIASAIGAGGMGEVYRARDTKPGRDVALKVVPE